MKPEWKTNADFVPYPDALAFMEARVDEIIAGNAPEMVWLLEHPPLITSGTSAKSQDLKPENKFPVYAAGRGGQYTYHGPGQRVVYVMLDLKKRGVMDIRKYVWNLEQWIINTLAHFDVRAERREGRIGIWASLPRHPREGGDLYCHSRYADREIPASAGMTNKNEAKIAAIGIRIRKWVTFHGISINVNPDLSHFNSIVPCGISEYGVTSLADLGKNISMEELDKILKKEFEKIF